ncbi:uncharacterized protein LOC113549028 [Rhopalosiphum maidis]|uniref:uncharacterized protein LOC113549028 n=1 Tax=Rhopalosiphum maidis TaxID=43146 RepID=UPI000F00B699|nr:uncharacterized protein LOC113549028 [Rhopalosiphum maidis]
MGKPQYTQKFRNDWLNNKQFKDWLIEVEDDETKAKYFSTSRQLSKFIKPETSKSNSAEGSLSLFVAAHTSILPVNHLGELCKKVFHGCDSANELKLHRTKCTNIIVNILAPHFNGDLLNSIGSRHYSIINDESTNISVTELLGITILYFNKETGEVVSTYLALVEMITYDAVSIINAIINTLKIKAVSAAANVTLPRHIDFLVKETYNWFAHSTLRQNEYKTLNKAINDRHSPLIIILACGTRWLSIESAINRILEQWVELKLLFQMARTKEKCFTAEILYNLYNDQQNFVYLTFLSPVLFEVQSVNKAFKSNTADPLKLLSTLSNLVQSVSKK